MTASVHHSQVALYMEPQRTPGGATRARVHDSLLNLGRNRESDALVAIERSAADAARQCRDAEIMRWTDLKSGDRPITTRHLTRDKSRRTMLAIHDALVGGHPVLLVDLES